MTDRIKGLTVTLDRDYRDDDVRVIVDAIKMIRGVAAVELHVTQIEDHMARQRVRYDVQDAILGVLKGITDPTSIP